MSDPRSADGQPGQDLRAIDIAVDAESCYRAVESRDARFAGKFYVAVATTGIYCRPGCPARTPRRDNVRFYPSAAAAEGAGFRACLRCRPEAAPGTSAWSGTEATIARAVRLLEESGHASGLADRLGVGDRHLRRLFARHLGASPAAVLRTRRLHLARQIIESSALPMIDVAHAAGFTSLRRFNEAVKRGFGRPPTELRAKVGTRSSPSSPGTALSLRLPFRPPLDFARLLAFLEPRCIPGIEAIQAGAYLRTVREGIVEVRPGGAAYLELRLPLALSSQAFGIVARVQRLFDLRVDPQPIARHLATDPLLAPLVTQGLRVPGAWEPFEMAVRAVLGQQISVQRARDLAREIALEHGEVLPHGLLFPPVERLAQVELKGMPGARARSIRALAQAVASGALTLDAATTIDQLRAVPGIGPWTAEVISMRALASPDAFPSGDLGLCKTMQLDPRALEARAERWRPWRSYAAAAIWSAP